jgi:hypothetical protein
MRQGGFEATPLKHAKAGCQVNEDAGENEHDEGDTPAQLLNV